MTNKITTYVDCCAQNIAIGISSIILLYIGIEYQLIDYKNNLIILLLWFTILLEMSKTSIQMLIGDDAPIKLRYASASMVVVSFKEAYISMLAKDMLWMFAFIGASLIFLFIRKYAIDMTKDGR